MADEVHEVVTLLLARMESNPEEFEFHASGSLAVTGRWETWIAQLGWHFNEAEKALIYGKARELIFQRIHGEVLDELLNGEDRRRKEREEQEYERNLSQSLQHLKQQQLRVGTLSGDMNPTGYASGGGGGGAGIVGSYDYDLDRYRNTPTGSITNAVKPKPSPYDKIMNALKKGK
jgi:hypothetical protein